MIKKRKTAAIGFCVLFLIGLALLEIRISPEGLLCRYLYPQDVFLVLEDSDRIELSCNVILDGKRRMIKAYASPKEENLYYIFLPAGAGKNEVRIINNLSHGKWKSAVQDFTKITVPFANGMGEIRIAVSDTGGGEESSLCIRFMEASGQPTVFVETKETLDRLLQDRDLKVEGNVCIYDAQARTLMNDTIKFKGHGNGSWDNNSKKSWLLDFKEPASVLGMDTGYKYIAVSNAQDVSYIRNRFVYDMAADLGLAHSPQSEFVNFYVNGEYLGLYLLTEGIEASQERISVGRDRQETWKRKGGMQYYERIGEKGYRMPDGIPEDENVGYLLREEDNEDRYAGMECAFITENGAQFDIIYPKKATEKQILNIKNYMQALHSAIESEDGYCDTPQGRKHYSELIDLDSFIRKYLIEQISKNHDGNTGSSYFYIDILDGNAVLYEGPVWDYDIAFGNIVFNEMWREPRGLIKLNPGLDQREEFMACVVQYYEEYFKPYLETEAEKKIREDADRIRFSALMDRARWEDDNVFWEDSFDDGVDQLLDFIYIRKQFLDDVWLHGKTFYRMNFVDGDTIVKTVYLEEGASVGAAINTYTISQDKDGMSFQGWYDERLEEEISHDSKVTEDMALWAKWE